MINKSGWIFLMAATFFMVIIMAITGKPMKHPATPMGIINLELASNARDVQNILNAWDNDISQNRDVLADARKNTWLDFIFIFCYTAFFYFLCKKTSLDFKANLFLQKTGKLFSYFAITAGILDIAENAGMLLSLNGHITNGIALFTAICSGIKWILVISIILFLLAVFCYNYFFENNKQADDAGYN